MQAVMIVVTILQSVGHSLLQKWTLLVVIYVVVYVKLLSVYVKPLSGVG